MEGIWIRTNNYGSGSRRGPKTYRYGSGTLRKTVICDGPGETLPALFLSTGEADTMVSRDWVEHTRDRLGEQNTGTSRSGMY
jgi:hypothetical protein